MHRRNFLTISHVKLMQSRVLEQKHFGLRSLSPAICNLSLLLVVIQSSFGRIICCFVCLPKFRNLLKGTSQDCSIDSVLFVTNAFFQMNLLGFSKLKKEYLKWTIHFLT